MERTSTVPRPDVHPAAWDALADSSDDAWLWHRSEFLDAMGTWPTRTDASFAVVDSRGNALALVPLSVVRGPGPGVLRTHWLDSQGGPAFRIGLSSKERDRLWAAVHERLSAVAEANRAVHTVISLSPLAPIRLLHPEPVNPLLAQGLENALTHTCLIDVTVPESDLFAGYAKTTRQEVRRAQERVVVREAAGSGDCAAYYALHCETYGRTGATPHPFEYFEAIFGRLQPRGLCRILFAMNGDHVVAAQNTAITKAGAQYWTGASRDERSGGENRLLGHCQLLRARADGCYRYEMGETFPGTTDAKLAGLSHFKRGFGGTLAPLYRGRLRRRPWVALGMDAASLARARLRSRRSPG